MTTFSNIVIINNVSHIDCSFVLLSARDVKEERTLDTFTFICCLYRSSSVIRRVFNINSIDKSHKNYGYTNSHGRNSLDKSQKNFGYTSVHRRDSRDEFDGKYGYIKNHERDRVDVVGVCAVSRSLSRFLFTPFRFIHYTAKTPVIANIVNSSLVAVL